MLRDENQGIELSCIFIRGFSKFQNVVSKPQKAFQTSNSSLFKVYFPMKAEGTKTILPFREIHTKGPKMCMFKKNQDLWSENAGDV